MYCNLAQYCCNLITMLKAVHQFISYIIFNNNYINIINESTWSIYEHACSLTTDNSINVLNKWNPLSCLRTRYRKGTGSCSLLRVSHLTKALSPLIWGRVGFGASWFWGRVLQLIIMYLASVTSKHNWHIIP